MTNERLSFKKNGVCLAGTALWQIAAVRPLIKLRGVLDNPVYGLASAGKTVDPPLVAMRVSDDHMPAGSLLVRERLYHRFLVRIRHDKISA